MTSNQLPLVVYFKRPKEEKLLEEYLEEAIQGRGAFVVVNGEARSGKNSFVNHVLSSALKERASRYHVYFNDDNQFDPYRPFWQMVERISSGSSDFQRVHKSLKTFFNDSENGSADFSSESRYALQKEHSLIQQQLAQLLWETAKIRPLVIELHDCFNASLSAWRFIHYLCEKIADQRVLMVATLRQDGKEVRHDKVPLYTDVLQRMNREGIYQKIQLSPFSYEEFRRGIYENLKATDFSSGFLPMFFELSGGMPGTIYRYLKLFIQQNYIYCKNGVWFNKEGISSDEVISDVTRDDEVDSAAKVLDRLNERQRKLIKYAAFLPTKFSPAICAIVTGEKRLQLIKNLTELEKNKLLRSTEQGSYYFRSPELRVSLVNLLDDRERSEVHETIARRLEADSSTAAGVYMLAYHYRHAGNRDKGLHYALKAGHLAMRHFAFHEAREFFEQVYNEQKDIAVCDAMELTSSLAWLNRVLGEYESSVAYYKKALALLDADNNQNRRRESLLIELSFTYFRLNDWEKARGYLNQCLQRLDVLTPFERSLVFSGLGNIDFELGAYKEAGFNYTRALDFATEAGAENLQALIRNNMGALENVSGNPLKAINLYSKAIPYFEKHQDNNGLARINHNIGMSYADVGQWARANEFYGKSLSFSDKIGIKHQKAITFLNRALALVHMDDMSGAREYNFKAQRLLETMHDRLGLAEYHKIQGIIEKSEGEDEKAAQSFREALALFKSNNNKLGYAETLWEQALFLAEKDPPEAVQGLRRAAETFKELGLTQKLEYVNKLLLRLKDAPVTSG